MNAVTRAERRRVGQPALDLIEEAVALLRRAPAEALFVYLLGAIPFWLALLYFLSDMSRNAYAALHVSESSLAVALLYIWMKCWQTVFCRRLRAILAEQPDEAWTAARIGRLVMAQAAWQPWGFLLRPIAALITVPYGWIVVFFQNLTVLGDGSAEDGSSLGARAWLQARLWPRQAHVALGVLWIFGFFVWINVLAVLGLAPFFLKMFFAIETAFSRSLDAYFNTTFLTASLALTALAVDPLWKAIFVVRCFRGGALRTGEDLAVELKQARRMARAPALAACAFVLFFASLTVSTRAAANEPATVEASVLDQRISEVLARREYAWRAPREKIPEEENVGWFRAWTRGIGKAIQSSIKAAARSVQKAVDALYNKLFNRAAIGSSWGWDWLGAAKATLVLLAAAGVGVIAWGLWRLFRGGRSKTAATVAVAAVPDLHAEDVAADQLPEEGWLVLAREHAGRGELQLALRAAWLAGLAHLGARQLLSIARHKSNRDYDRELRRRARTRDDLLAAFDQNLTAFERSWYGRHPVRPDDFTAFEGNLTRIREC